jgi:hypothetical protein
MNQKQPKTDDIKDKDKIRKYFEEKYLKLTCFDTLDELLNDKTLVQVNAPRTLIACELVGIWKGLNDKNKEFEQKEQSLKKRIEDLNAVVDSFPNKSEWIEIKKYNQLKKEIERLNKEIEIVAQTKYVSVMNLIHRCNELEKRLRGKTFTKEEIEKWGRIMKDPKKIEELKKTMFMLDGKIPKCARCGKPMKRYTPTKGKFKGQEQEYSWVCECTPNMVLSVG